MTLMRTTQVNPAEEPFAMLSGKWEVLLANLLRKWVAALTGTEKNRLPPFGSPVAVHSQDPEGHCLLSTSKFSDVWTHLAGGFLREVRDMVA